METFTELSIHPELMKAITELGFTKPSPVQAQALPILLGEPTDFIGLAATGTGKTAAFGIPALNQIDPAGRYVQTLILCPTRELALQVSGQINLLGKYLGIKSVPIYGGAGYGDQIAGLRRGAQVVVGTPGRVVDHLTRGTLDIGNVQTVILDEADEMISMGFKDDLEAVLDRVTEESKIWLFSATMSSEVRGVSSDYLTNPKKVEINRTEMLPESLEQIYYTTQESNKPEVLCKLIDMAPDFFGIVFCQTKSLVQDLTQYLKSRGYFVDCLHGDMDQNARERTMRAFRERRVKVLICTDVASRGLDVKDITHVINYSIPRELDSYVHRIGRTARSGKAGLAMSLVTPSHRGLLRRIEQMTKSRLIEGKIPTRKEIGMKKVGALFEKFEAETNLSRVMELLPSDVVERLESMPQTEVAARLVSMLLPEVFGQERDGKPEGSGMMVDSRGGGRGERGEREEAPRNGRSFTPRPTPSGNGLVVKPLIRSANSAPVVSASPSVKPVITAPSDLRPASTSFFKKTAAKVKSAPREIEADFESEEEVLAPVKELPPITGVIEIDLDQVDHDEAPVVEASEVIATSLEQMVSDLEVEAGVVAAPKARRPKLLKKAVEKAAVKSPIITGGARPAFSPAGNGFKPRGEKRFDRGDRFAPRGTRPAWNRDSRDGGSERPARSGGFGGGFGGGQRREYGAGYGPKKVSGSVGGAGGFKRWGAKPRADSSFGSDAPRENRGFSKPKRSSSKPPKFFGR